MTDSLAMVERLGAEDAQIVLAIQAGNAQTELSNLLVEIATLKDPVEIEVKIDRANELRKQFDQITGAIKEIEGRKLIIDTPTSRRRCSAPSRTSGSSRPGPWRR